MFKLKWKCRTAMAALAATVAVMASGVAGATGPGQGSLGDKMVGPQPDGSYLTQTNQFVTPAGDVIKEDGRPFGLALAPNGQTAAALNTGGGTTGTVSIFDLAHHTLLQQTGTGSISDGGIVYSPDGKYLWMAQPGDLQRFSVQADGTVSDPVTVPLPGVDGRAPVPAGLAWAPNGKLLVTLSANNTLGVVDPATNTLEAQIPVGNDPNSVVAVGDSAYVSNQGGRPAGPSDKTDSSYGTPIVTNNQSAVPSTGTVSEVNLQTGTQVRTFPVGLEPSALAVDGSSVLVANSDDDSVTSIDTANQRLGRTFSVNPAPGSPFGASPNGLTLLDASHLAVSLGRFNTVAIYDYHGPYQQPVFDGLIPTGSYPTGIAEDEGLGRLVVASEQGVGSVGPDGTISEGTGTNPATSHLGYNFVGTVQTIATPSRTQLAQDTQQVFSNNQWQGLLARNQRGNGLAAPVPVPRRIGDPSTIKHVFLIVKENRTYDQVLGDIGKGNSDPQLAQFGEKVTPNTHALARQFPLIDNLYSDGTNSAEGHHWLDQAFVNNYMQQMYGNYTRSYQTGDPLSNVKSGWIWEDALAHGKSVVNWGEDMNSYNDAAGNSPPSGSWSKWLHDADVLAGKSPGPLNYPLGTYTAKTDIPSLQAITKPDFPNFNLDIPDQYRASMFQNDFSKYVANNNLPALNLMWVMNDHTNGTAPGGISPEAHVADNDLALGRIVDTISHSKYWKSTAIFVIEDDSQNGVDHVDGHRNLALIASPYARRGAIVSDYYSQTNMMRTIEQILGIPPMNSQDMTAEPMYDAFTNTPNDTPYTVVPNQISLTETNPPPTCPKPAFPNLVPQSQMTATATSNEVGYAPSNAIDGNCSTFWHTEYSPTMAKLPQSITLNLGGTYDTSGITYVPRQDGNENGVITGYSVSVSTDGQNFTPVTSGTWADDPSAKAATWTPTPARYVRLQATAGHNGYASADELNVAYATSSTSSTAKTTAAAKAVKAVEAAWTRWSLQTAWGRWSAKQDWTSEDMVNMAQGNRDVWYSTSRFTKPYPGDKRVLYPYQVPGSDKPPA